MTARVLVVDDVPANVKLLEARLSAEYFDVATAMCGADALAICAKAECDIVLLDVMMPDMDGFEVCRRLKSNPATHHIPVVMVTALDQPSDRVAGLEAGADDYLPKPFELQILLARLRGLLRRREWLMQPHDHEQLSFAGKMLDLEALELHVGDKKYQLTQMESDLLQYLVKNAGKAISRKTILEEVWDLHEDTDTRAIDNFVVRLRRYIEPDPTKPQHLVTVRGIGYKFVS